MFDRTLRALRLALSQLRRNLVRSALTSLGILIGVGAVIAMVGLGNGATQSIQSDLSSIGVNLLFLTPGTRGGPGHSASAPPFDAADADAISQQIPALLAVAPLVSTNATAVYGGLDMDTSVTGATNDYFTAMARGVAEGRLFTEGEVRSGSAVCLLGQTVRETLFGDLDPIGADMRMGATSCAVIGILEAKGENTMGMDQDDLVIAPMAMVQRRMLGTTNVSLVLISVADPLRSDEAKAAIEALMDHRRHVSGDATRNFTVSDTKEMASMVRTVTSVLTAFLAAVAGVSLLVGGIGIMNIMLVSVTERTREIGIRMAIGALEGDVMMQFLVEALVLGALGGVLGVAFGIGATAIGAWAIHIPFVVNPLVVVGAVAFSGLMGVAFGWFPARRAARLEPIEALRHG